MARPSMTPSTPRSRAVRASARLPIPPFRTISRPGISRFSRYTRSGRSGGISRFSRGLSPFSHAFRAWTMRVEHPAPATAPAKSRSRAWLSRSSIPIRVLTVTGIETAPRMAATHSATRAGRAMRAAPKHPRCTRGLGQPTLRFTSS